MPCATVSRYRPLVGRQKRGRKRSARRHGGRTRRDAGHPPIPQVEGATTEPTSSELLARAQDLRQTALAVPPHGRAGATDGRRRGQRREAPLMYPTRVGAASMPMIDAVISDISLPDGDGCELLRLLRECRDGAPLLAIALTGHGEPECRERCEHAGYRWFLTKPVHFKELLEAVATLRPPKGPPVA